ncbi:MAG: Fic family protein, partial [Ignavibacteriaceae bacterium]|nr:Fic family protein [Ignavibacteriaceae bacterium]
MHYKISKLPFDFEIETKAVLKKTALARSALAEMKGVASTIPNQNILITTLSLQEAKDSSAIENIITTQDDLYQSDEFTKNFKSIAAKEVHRYAKALRSAFETIKQQEFISSNQIIQIQEMIVDNSAGFRKLPGTTLKNEMTGEIVYTPPQNYSEIVDLMNNLELFINDSLPCDWDPLVKLAVIHHQFESIHPFYDGNGRTGRILNVLYLVKKDLLSIPILYLSRYINQNKAEYYNLLQKVRTDNSWEEWILYILEGIEKTSLQTIKQITGIKELMQSHKQTIRNESPKIYSQDLINNIFRHPYTKINFVMNDLNVSRKTAIRYLDELVRIKILSKFIIKSFNFTQRKITF